MQIIASCGSIGVPFRIFSEQKQYIILRAICKKKSRRTGIIKMKKAIFTGAAAAAGIWRITEMTNKAMNCVKSIGLGLAVGTAAGVICKCASDSRSHTLRRRAKHAAGVMEDLLDNVTYLFK